MIYVLGFEPVLRECYYEKVQRAIDDNSVLGWMLLECCFLLLR